MMSDEMTKRIAQTWRSTIEQLEPRLRREIAAACLYGQPFGFTHEMVAAIRRCAEFSGPDKDSELANQAADHIADLLPPEKEAT